MSHAWNFMSCCDLISRHIEHDQIERLVGRLNTVREDGGRVFVIGAGGSAANASHFVNDLRRLCHIEAYAPTDNVAELTACTNDDGWHKYFVQSLATSHLDPADALFVLSVGGGTKTISAGIGLAIAYAKSVNAAVLGIVGRDGGETKAYGDEVLVITTVAPELVTPLTEAFQSVICHAIVSHPKLQARKAKWESQCVS